LPASVSVDGDRVVALLERPVHGIAPGQTLAVYTGTRVLGSATLGRDPSR
nr:tRNA 2-thiouridine(34) synthase MnmA [Nocardioidaceae bacterium]